MGTQGNTDTLFFGNLNGNFNNFSNDNSTTLFRIKTVLNIRLRADRRSLLRLLILRDRRSGSTPTPPREFLPCKPSIITVINPSFMGVFLGTAATWILMAVSSLSRWHQPGVLYLLLGTLLYLVGIVGVTILCNLPLNEALAKSDGCGDRTVRSTACDRNVG